jgi:hypothetical protein
MAKCKGWWLVDKVSWSRGIVATANPGIAGSPAGTLGCAVHTMRSQVANSSESVLVAASREHALAVALQDSCGKVRTSARRKDSHDSGIGTIGGAEIEAMWVLPGTT